MRQQLRSPSVPASVWWRRARGQRGAALLEALIALGIVVSTIAGVAHLFVWARRAIWTSGSRTSAVAMAAQKLEQLRALPWEIDAAGTLVSDVTTDLSVAPPSAAGSGLGSSPAGSLHTSTNGYVDYLDGFGTWRGGSVAPPAAARFVRRWAITPLPGDPDHSLILHVVVLPLADEGAGDRRWSGRAVYLSTVRSRSVP